MLINIPSQRQVCYNPVRGRVRGKKKKVKGREKNFRPHRTSQYTPRQVVPLLLEEEQTILL